MRHVRFAIGPLLACSFLATPCGVLGQDTTSEVAVDRNLVRAALQYLNAKHASEGGQTVLPQTFVAVYVDRVKQAFAMAEGDKVEIASELGLSITTNDLCSITPPAHQHSMSITLRGADRATVWATRVTHTRSGNSGGVTHELLYGKRDGEWRLISAKEPLYFDGGKC